MIELAVKLLASYLVGSVLGSLVVGRLRGGVDIRALGSGNAGGTNALRTQGKAFALGVVLIDVGKGLLATAAIAPAALPALPAAPVSWQPWLPALCATGAIVGHVYPVWHGFRGGKGAATLVGALLGLQPWLLVAVLLVWLVVVMLTGFVGLASICAVLSLPLVVLAATIEPRMPLLAFATFVAVLVAFTHRQNLARMRAGTEPRARRLWLLRPRERE